MTIVNVYMYNSTEYVEHGHGFRCERCFRVLVANSTFEGLQAYAGGAIALIEMAGSMSKIVNNTFRNNQAGIGGAIKLENPATVNIKGNNFTGNSAIKIEKNWRRADGGAIYYSCSPKYTETQTDCEVSLHENRFENNTALNKGGAARWVNKNFTFQVSDVQ